MENPNTNTCDCKMCQKWGWCPVTKSGKIIKWVVVVIVITFILSVVLDRGDWRGDGKPVNTISFSGKGEVVVQPDIVTISFGVSAENLDVSKAQTESATKMNNIIDFLGTKGVDKKDIKTTNYSIYPRYDYINNNQTYPYGGKQVLAAYVVSQNVEVKIRKVGDAGAILSGVGEYGVTDISGLNFSLDKIDEVKDQARDLAIEDAKTQAKSLAKSLGVRLVKITSFSENANYPMYYGMEKAMNVGMGGDSAVAPQIPVGENKITSNVTITYEIR